MSRPVSPIVCDGPGCGKQKQETNRWWTVEVKGQDLRVLAGTYTRNLKDREYFDFCGQTCALKFISEQMSKVTS
jgi:hypothetical protein